jgi:hypothetical protein
LACHLPPDSPWLPSSRHADDGPHCGRRVTWHFLLDEWLLVDIVNILWWMYGECMVTVWWMYGDCMVNVWLIINNNHSIIVMLSYYLMTV